MLRESRVLAIVGLTAVLLAACSSGPSPSDVAASLTADLPMVERLHVNIAFLAETAACQEVDYSRGVFVTDPASEACAGLVAGHPSTSAFDAQARADVDELLQDSERHGFRLQSISSADYSDSGHLTFGYFRLVGVEDGYMYMPGEALTYTPDSACGEPVNADWFREYECRYYKWPWEVVALGPG